MGLANTAIRNIFVKLYFWNSINEVSKQEASTFKMEYFQLTCHERERGRGKREERERVS